VQLMWSFLLIFAVVLADYGLVVWLGGGAWSFPITIGIALAQVMIYARATR